MSSSSEASSASPYIGDEGPGFDPSQEPPATLDASAQEALAQAAEPLTEEQMREWLEAFGQAAHTLAGVGEHDWEMTQKDLERIAPPATRIVNRYDPAGRVAAMSDPVMVGYGAFTYSVRSMLERRAVLRAREERKRAQRAATGPAGPEPEDLPDVDVDQVDVAEQEHRPEATLNVAEGYMTVAERMAAARAAAGEEET